MSESLQSTMGDRVAPRTAAVVLTLLLLVLLAIQIRGHRFGALDSSLAIPLLFDLPIAVLGGLCWTRGWSRSPRILRASSSAFIGGLLVGGPSFVAGFVGPILLSDANLGPLVGILFTGPIGFILGAMGGAVHGLRRARVPRG